MRSRSLYEAGWHWIEAGLTRLAENHDPLRAEILQSQRLRPCFDAGSLDRIDLYSASLISAALDRGLSTSIVLPDGQVRRPAFLFAYTLLNVWWRTRELPGRPKVLYCGATPGIREQLAKIRVSGLRLDSVFDQVDLPRGRLGRADKTASDNADSQLPRVITAYAPADSPALISELRPRCIAVDYDDSGSLPWLAELLEAARESRTTVLSWGSNPLSNVRREFVDYGHTVVWPFGRSQDGDAEFCLSDPPEVLFQPFTVTQIHPLLVTGGRDCRYSAALERASAKLREVSRVGLGTFGITALQQHWKLYREVEGLHVPLGIIEAEASNFWGASAPSRSLAICRRFQEILASREPSIAASLSSATEALGEAVEWLNRNEPPLWQALCRLVQSPEKSGHARLITFTNRTKKALFLFALLAKHNLTEEDLRTHLKWLVTLDSLRRSASAGHGLSLMEDGTTISKHLSPMPLLVGLPSAHGNSKLWPVFLADEVVVLAHALQARTLAWRAGDWSRTLSMDLQGLTQTLSALLRLPAPSQTPPLTSRVELCAAIQVDGATAESKEAVPNTLFVGPDLEEEMALLFEEDASVEGLNGVPPEGPSAEEEFDPWVETAIRLRFAGGWRGMFEPTARLNYIDRAAGELHERYVRSLRVGDTVLVVPLQRRQALYDLVIARVHQHPAIQLHLALLNRWHSDLVQGYKDWSVRDRRVERLLSALRARGSRLSSSLAVHFWITGATLCPIDPEDIRRIAEVLRLDFVAAHYKKIAHAASRIRGLHRGLSNRLNHWLRDRAHGRVVSHDHEIIDEETRLTFGEVRESFVITEVQGLTPVVGPFLRSSLGIISRGSG